MDFVEDDNQVLPSDAYYELKPDEMLVWCMNGVRRGLLEQAREDDMDVFYLTRKGLDFLDAAFRKNVEEMFKFVKPVYTEEEFLRVLAKYVEWKNSTTHPVACLVQVLFESNEYRQSLN